MAVKLSSPWFIYYRQLEAMFSRDEDVHVIFDGENSEIKLYVDTDKKAEALFQLLPDEKTFGSYVLKISIVPANGKNGKKFEASSSATLVSNALEENDAVSYIETVQVGTNPMTFVVFVKEVVQYFTDDLGDIHGIHSTLYQDLAKEVFGELGGVYFCTDVESSFAQVGTHVQMPLGEWP